MPLRIFCLERNHISYIRRTTTRTLFSILSYTYRIRTTKSHICDSGNSRERIFSSQTYKHKGSKQHHKFTYIYLYIRKKTWTRLKSYIKHNNEHEVVKIRIAKIQKSPRICTQIDPLWKSSNKKRRKPSFYSTSCWIMYTPSLHWNGSLNSLYAILHGSCCTTFIEYIFQYRRRLVNCPRNPTFRASLRMPFHHIVWRVKSGPKVLTLVETLKQKPKNPNEDKQYIMPTCCGEPRPPTTGYVCDAVSPHLCRLWTESREGHRAAETAKGHHADTAHRRSAAHRHQLQ